MDEGVHCTTSPEGRFSTGPPLPRLTHGVNERRGRHRLTDLGAEPAAWARRGRTASRGRP